MTAETVQMEWRYARQEGVCICPVMEEAQISFDGMPRWMTKVNFFDIDKEWPKLVTVLRRGCTAPRVPFMAPEVREPIVHRRDQMERLKTYLLSANRPDKAVVTLVGPGGFGKTTLAADLCHSEEIIEHFDNGILWVQLGQEPDVLRKLMGLYKALTGDRPQFDDIGDGASQLEKQLKDRDFLIVIDDVWSAEHLRPFLRGGRSCARLVTTRDAHIAQETEKLEIDRMSPAESSALLTSGLPGLDAAQTGPLSEQLGGWPLALELARATMRRPRHRRRTRIESEDPQSGRAPPLFAVGHIPGCDGDSFRRGRHPLGTRPVGHTEDHRRPGAAFADQRGPEDRHDPRALGDARMARNLVGERAGAPRKTGGWMG